jgi:dipicolinate synthase subunit A
MIYAAEMLAMAGFRVFTFGLSENPKEKVTACETADDALHADFFLLPIPMSLDGKTLFAPACKEPIFISELLEKAPSHATFFGGKTDAFSDPRIADYGASADFAARNALPTAEGALLLAIKHLSCTVDGAQVGITGFGKIGKATAALFQAAGADVTIFARRAEVCSVASVLGYKAEPLDALTEHSGTFRCLINTVPAPIIGEETLSGMRRDALLLELASAPYGIDLDLANKKGLNTILASGLPGKYSPETAGIAIAKTVFTMLYEKGISIL